MAGIEPSQVCSSDQPDHHDPMIERLRELLDTAIANEPTAFITRRDNQAEKAIIDAHKVDLALLSTLGTRRMNLWLQGILMKNLKISEPEAFKWMQKTAMDKRRSMTDVAQLVMDEFEKN